MSPPSALVAHAQGGISSLASESIGSSSKEGGDKENEESSDQSRGSGAVVGGASWRPFVDFLCMMGSA